MVRADVQNIYTTRRAPTLDIPDERVVSVEHPCIIRNFDKAFKSLGGESQLKHVGDSRLGDKYNQLPEPVAGLSLRPDDPFAKKIASTGVETRNILIKVTLPKRTGRKRKRGSDEPFIWSEESRFSSGNITAPELLQRLRDNEHQYDIQAVGMLQNTHRFRSLPDFQIRASEIPIMRELREHAMSPNYDQVKDLFIDPSPDVSPGSVFPAPPSFTSIDIGHKYEYQQAAGIVVSTDEHGHTTSKNVSAPPRRIAWSIAPDAAEVPQGPPASIRRRNPGGTQVPLAIRELTKLLATRPLVTKRVALNALPAPVSDSIFKEATQWVGYSFKAGPWRDSLIRYGVDPRRDPQYRIYQTLMFHVDMDTIKPLTAAADGRSDGDGAAAPTAGNNAPWARTSRATRADPATYIFDGRTVSTNGKTWQICDVTDPTVRALFDTTDLRRECDVFQWGWYGNGTMAKARVIMKDKIKHLFAGLPPPEGDYGVIAALPNELTRGRMHEAVLSVNTHGARLAALSTEVRNIAKMVGASRWASSSAWKRKAEGMEGRDAGDDEDEEGNEGGEGGEKDGDGEVDGDSVVDEEDEGEGDFGEMDDGLAAQEDEEADGHEE